MQVVLYLVDATPNGAQRCRHDSWLSDFHSGFTLASRNLDKSFRLHGLGSTKQKECFHAFDTTCKNLARCTKKCRTHHCRSAIL